MDRNTLSPCATDALFGTRQLMVAGKQVGITGLDATFAAVQAQGLIGDAEISAELVRRIRENNYIPPGLAGDYAAAVLAEYKRAMAKNKSSDPRPVFVASDRQHQPDRFGVHPVDGHEVTSTVIL